MNNHLSLTKKLIEKLDLPMKVLSVEENEEGILTFRFTSESKVDLRDLIKKLQEQTKRRVLLQSVGVQEATRFLASVGPCGQKLCCATFLKNSNPFSPGKWQRGKDEGDKTGMCGKSLCCLAFEEKTKAQGDQITPTPEPSPMSQPTPSLKESQKAAPRAIIRVLPSKKSRHRR